MILYARYIAPIAQPAIENGFVEVVNGRICETGRRHIARGRDETDLGDVVLFPGFVNAHTHLELSHLRDRVDPSLGFVHWIERIGRCVLADDAHPEVFAAAARQGATESLQHGVTLVCDITRRPDRTRPELKSGPLRVVSCGEVIAAGNIRHLAGPRIAAACDRRHGSAALTIGLSPHSPYLCERNVWLDCVAAADRESVLITVHAAESMDEHIYMTQGDGPMATFLQRLGLAGDDSERTSSAPIEFLFQVGALGPRTLLAHGNYLTDSDLQRIAQSRAAVVYCPRTHAAFGHPPHPLPRLLSAGIDVCLGTDSLASNPSLSVLDEARTVLERYPQLSPACILEMITSVPGRRLGPSHDYATLAAGSPADLTAVRLEAAGPQDPVENVMRSTEQPIAVWIEGKRVLAAQSTPQ